MIITHTSDTTTPQEQILNIFPNQFLTDREKDNPDFIKRNMDYFYTVAIGKYTINEKTFAKNYDVVKGILHPEDFYQEEIQDFATQTLRENPLPEYVQSFSIFAPVINDMVGEMSKRPDNAYVKAFDDDSQQEELQMKSEMLKAFITQKVQQLIQEKAALTGQQLEDDQLQQLSEEELAKELDNYTSLAEKWGAHMLEALKVSFQVKEKSEEGFRDLLITARESYLIYEDTTPQGFNVKTLNPKEVWELKTPGHKYISDPLEPSRGAYAAGTIQLLEISEILNEIKLDEEEIQHLYNVSQQAYLITTKESNLFNGKTGEQSIDYNTYDPAILKYRLTAEAALYDGQSELKEFLGISDAAGAFGHKFAVVRAYWCSKKKVGKLTYIDVNGIPQSIFVDENYKNKSHPQQIDLEWGWTNQWYEGIKIGQDVYKCKAFELLDYCPIIGVTYEGKNTTPKSFVDLGKPYQTMHNIFMNKLYESIQKDYGKILVQSVRHIPTPKDGDPQDAIDIWKQEIKDSGMDLIDDSPENTKGPSAFNQFAVHDFSRVQEMVGYHDMAERLKQSFYDIVGVSRQRLGNVLATETATGTNTALSQSYAQTEPWFIQHEYVINKLYQALLDAALYIESNKPQSTIKYISNLGESGFVQINGSDLKLRDLKVFVTSRAEDAQAFKDLRGLSQAMLQNGAAIYDVACLYTTKSVRQIKDTFKQLKEEQQKAQAQKAQQDQQQLDQQQKQFEAQQQMAIQQHSADQQWESYEHQLDRLSKERIAITNSLGYGKVEGEDANANGIQDALETSKLNLDVNKATNDYQLKLKQIQQQELVIQQKMKEAQDKMSMHKDNLKAEQDRTKAQLKIAKMKPRKG